MPDGAMLGVRDLHSWYGESHILHGTSFDVARGEVVTLLGRNGAGKTTTLKSIMGMVTQRKGSVKFDAAETIGLASNQIAKLGIAICPEERGIFASLDVEENLLLPPKIREGGLATAQVFELFPNLKERLRSQGTRLSGGEQQMLAIARALMSAPSLLLVDEPSVGLAPILVSHTITKIKELKEKYGLTVLMAEQNFHQAIRIADRGYIIVHGEIVFEGGVKQLEQNELVKSYYLGT
jgi:branched-chain amino acid transport system ATP-binding protein